MEYVIYEKPQPGLPDVNFLLVNRYGKEITLSHIPNFEVGKVNRVHGFFEIF